MRFGKKGKFSPRFIGPYEVIEKGGPVEYILAFPPDLEKIHNVFHVSMLRRYRSNPSHVVSSETIELRLGLTYKEEPVELLYRAVKELWKKRIPFGKSYVEKPQDRGSHVGKRRSYAATIPTTVR